MSCFVQLFNTNYTCFKLKLLLICSCFFVFPLFSQDLSSVRRLYLKAGEERAKTDEFLNYIEESDNSGNSLIQAYHGTALTMKAERVKGGLKKYSVFTRGRDMLEEAVKSRPDCSETKYLRFAVQSNIPKFLAYDNLEEDKRFLLQNLEALYRINDAGLRKAIFSTLLSSEYLNNEEKALVTSFLESKK